jgi:hypothetical protein
MGNGYLKSTSKTIYTFHFPEEGSMHTFGTRALGACGSWRGTGVPKEEDGDEGTNL